MKQPWWLYVIQWATIGTLTGTAFVDAVTDHGFLMAFNCFCLGFIAFSQLMRPLLRRRDVLFSKALADMQESHRKADFAAQKFQQAIMEGKIEFVPMDFEHVKPTRH